MIRKIIHIDSEKCNGCGACAAACHEGAIGMKEGKAVLMRDDYCDGLGDCLPACPTNAISFIEREAAEYDAEAVKRAQNAAKAPAGGCPGSRSRVLEHRAASAQPAAEKQESELMQWPVQIKLAPIHAPYYENANLLIAADCTAYAYANFHRDWMRGRITLIGCPKLDSVDYSEKLTEILKQNKIKSLTVVRMEVPCCGGLEHAATQALKDSGKFIPWRVVTFTTQGEILE
ncbi:ATP-binding protein [Acidaminobacterium chupaoyuni]